MTGDINKHFPLMDWKGEIPLGTHPGSFGFKRKHDIHTGVDLYTTKNDLVFSVESGIVINVEDYTGPAAGTPWWLPTKSILVEGESGVVCYGEIEPIGINKGDMVLAGQILAYVVPVLPKNKTRSDIPNHSNCMLHFELYTTGTKDSVVWNYDEDKPKNLLNPTNLLKSILKK